MAQSVFYRVHDHAVQGFIEPGGEVNDLVNKILYSGKMFAKAYAPVRTGRLKGNIRHANAKADGPFIGSGYIYANLGYAWYVEKGTTGPIRSTRGMVTDRYGNLQPAKMKFLAVKGKRAGTFVYRESVKGQRAQHFMENGLKSAMRLHT